MHGNLCIKYSIPSTSLFIALTNCLIKKSLFREEAINIFLSCQKISGEQLFCVKNIFFAVAVFSQKYLSLALLSHSLKKQFNFAKPDWNLVNSDLSTNLR